MKESISIVSTKIAHMCVFVQCLYISEKLEVCCGNIIIMNLNTSRQKDMTPVLTFAFMSPRRGMMICLLLTGPEKWQHVSAHTLTGKDLTV